MPYLYETNLDVLDRRDQLEIMLDTGVAALLRRGHVYDLTAGELFRARRYAIMKFVNTVADETPVGVTYMPVRGNPTEGQSLVWSSAEGVWVPSDVGVGGGGTGDVTTASLNAAIATHSSDTTSVHGIADTTVLASDAELASHAADSTAVHGITDTAALATSAGVPSAVATHEADTTSVHGIANTANLATAASVATAVSAHEADTTAVHGIADTSALATNAAVTSAVAAHESDTTAVHGLSSTAAAKGVAVHNGTSYPTRPTGFGSIEWIGPTTPASALDGDTWVPTA